MKNNEKKIDLNRIRIILFTINIFIFFVILLISYLYIVPKIFAIEDAKSEVSLLVNQYNDLKIKGLSYNDFKKGDSKEIPLFKKKVLLKIDRNFYNANFINNGKFNNYDEFLNYLKEEVNGGLKEDYEKKYREIYRVLPIYGEIDNGNNKEILTDFYFINMIENLLYKYDLFSNSDIGIKTIKKLNEGKKKKKDDMSTNIFIISLPLTIEGNKRNIIRFLEEITSMGKISLKISENGEKELFVNNGKLFSELNSLTMKTYIDSSTVVNKKFKNLLDLIKSSSQSREAFKIDVELLFYVQGLPNYKIRQEINNVIGKIPDYLSEKSRKEIEKINYGFLKARIKQLQLDNKNNMLLLQQLNDLDSYLNTISKDIVKITKEITKVKDLMVIYDKVEKYKRIFSIISQKIDKIEKKIIN